MTVPTWAGFVAYFPDDEIATSDEIAVYGGRNIALALGEIFASLGCSRISEPSYGGEVGWDFAFRYGDGHSFWCRVQSFHPIYWLLLEGPTSKRKAAARLELWRRFAEALEQNPGFDQIIWRSSKDGPPDWDEFTITVDLPKRRVLEELPHRPIRQKTMAAGGTLAPTAIGVWCALFVATWIVIEHAIPAAKAQANYKVAAMVALIFGLAIALPLIDRSRKRELPGSDENPAP